MRNIAFFWYQNFETFEKKKKKSDEASLNQWIKYGVLYSTTTSYMYSYLISSHDLKLYKISMFVLTERKDRTPPVVWLKLSQVCKLPTHNPPLHKSGGNDLMSPLMQGGYSDLVWMGLCCLSFKNHTHCKGHFVRTRYPLLRDFSPNRLIFINTQNFMKIIPVFC